MSNFSQIVCLLTEFSSGGRSSLSPDNNDRSSPTSNFPSHMILLTITVIIIN